MNESCQVAFDELKYRLTTSPILTFPRFDLQFRLACDMPVMLDSVQCYHRKLMGVAYASRSLHPPEKNYSVIERELRRISFIVWPGHENSFS